MIHFLNKRRAGSLLRLFSCLVALLAVSCITDDDLPTGEVYVQVGDTLPDFRVTLSDGTEFDTSTLGGSVSLIMFFDTSCPDCREMLPRVQQVYDSFRDQEGIRMAFISRAEDEASVASYWAEEGLTLTMPTPRAPSTACLPTRPSPASISPTHSGWYVSHTPTIRCPLPGSWQRKSGRCARPSQERNDAGGVRWTGPSLRMTPMTREMDRGEPSARPYLSDFLC